MNGSMQSRFQSISEVSITLGLSIPTINRRLKEGKIPFIKLGGRVLIPVEFIENLVQQALSASSEGRR